MLSSEIEKVSKRRIIFILWHASISQNRKKTILRQFAVEICHQCIHFGTAESSSATEARLRWIRASRERVVTRSWQSEGANACQCPPPPLSFSLPRANESNERDGTLDRSWRTETATGEAAAFFANFHPLADHDAISLRVQEPLGGF